jgi:transposase
MRSPSGRPGSTKRAPKRRWEVSDQDWRHVERVLERLDPALSTGRPRVNPRRALNGILYRAHTGCRWREIPPSYGDDATVHRTFRRWLDLGVLEKIRDVLAEPGRLHGDDGNDLTISSPAVKPRPRFRPARRGNDR